MNATMTVEQRVRDALRPIQDYPKPGILFQDITPVLGDGPLLRDVDRRRWPSRSRARE